MNRILTFALIALLTSLVACGGGSPNTTSGPPNASCTFSASPATISNGGSSTLTWACENTKRVTLNDVIVMPTGTKSVSPTSTTVYTLNSIGGAGAGGDTHSVTVTVTSAPAPTATLSASLLTINVGDFSTLTWTSTNGTSATLNGAGVTLNDNMSVSPAVTTTYTLIVTGTGGTATQSVTITVNGTTPPPAPTATLTANPTSVFVGHSSVLTWTSTNATSVTLNGAIVTLNGNQTVSPTVATTYTLVASGTGGTVTKAVTITISTGSNPLATVGRWTTLTQTMPINPVHAALLNTGKILVVSGSGNLNTQTTFYAGVLDPSNWNFAQQTVSWDMFCNGMVALSDGKILINGGTLSYGTAAPVGQPDVPFKGLATTSIFDPATSTFDYSLPPTAHGRWYPTLTEMADGRVLTFSGLEEDGTTNNYSVEVFDHKTDTWGVEHDAPAGFTPELYPRLHLLPTEQIYYSSPTTCSYTMDQTAFTWDLTACTIYGRGKGEGSADRTYGSSVLLPLLPETNYDYRVFIMGGDNPAQKTTEFIDLANANLRTACPDYAPCFEQGAPMSQARVEAQGVLLPTGMVLAFSGSAMDEQASTASHNVDLYNPATNTMSAMAPNAVTRLYHNVALLLPDASIWLAGSNPVAGTYEPKMERYEPPYLFNPDGSYAIRPQIVSSPASVTYGQSFSVQTDSSNIAYVEIMKNGSSTHSFDMEQRLVGLHYTQSGGTLTVTAPPTTDGGSGSGIAPPGYYMLFLMDSFGVPSMSTQIQVLGNGAMSAASSMAGRFQMVTAPKNLAARQKVPRSVTESPLKMRDSMGGMHH